MNQKERGQQPEKQLRIIMVMIENLENRVEKMQETFNMLIQS